MQKVGIALGTVAVMLLASMPANANDPWNFTFDIPAMNPGDQLFVGLDANNQPFVEVIPALDVFGPFQYTDACATLPPALGTCSGVTGSHSGSAGFIVPAGLYGGVLGPARIDTIKDYGAAGKTTWTCFLNSGGFIVGIFFFPPGTGFCTYTSFSWSGVTWTLGGASSGGAAGPVLHVAN